MQLKSVQGRRESWYRVDRGGILCSVFEGGKAIGLKDEFFLSSRVGGVGAFEEEVTVPMDNCVLKAVERGRYGGEAVLPKIMLEFLNAILNRRKGFAYIYGGGVALDE